jgi:hypothetical protein
MPTAPFFRPADGAAAGSTAADSVVTAGLLVRIGVRKGPAMPQSAESLALLGRLDNRRTHGVNNQTSGE